MRTILLFKIQILLARDGKMPDGQEAPPDVYVFRLVSKADFDAAVLEGDVTLVR